MSTQVILEKIDAIEASQSAKVEEAKQAVLDELNEKIAKLEARVASAPSINKFVGEKSARKDAHRRVAEQLSTHTKGGNTSLETRIELFESVDQYQAYLKEASGLTGSGDGKGGRTAYDPVFRTFRQMNPLRMTSRQVATDGSRYQFRVKTGQGGATWGYPVNVNASTGGIDNTGTSVNSASWDVILQDLNTQFPVRTAALADIDGLEANIVDDLMAEFSQAEGLAFVQNDPGSTAGTYPQVGSAGPKGLDSYAASGTLAAGAQFASVLSGTGAHNLATVVQGTVSTATANNVTIVDLINVMSQIPVQYRTPGMCWHINPILWQGIRALRDTYGAPVADRNNTFSVTGYEFELFGYPVILNNYLDSPLGGTGTVRYPLYFGDWTVGHTIVDSLSLSIKRYDQTVPGSITFYGEKRTQAAVKDPFALARLASTF